MRPTLCQKRIRALFHADECLRTMPWQDLSIVVEHEKAVFDGMDEFLEVAAPQIRAPDTLLEERVTRKNPFVAVEKPEANAAWTVSRRVQNLKPMFAEAQDLLIFEKLFNWRRRRATSCRKAGPASADYCRASRRPCGGREEPRKPI